MGLFDRGARNAKRRLFAGIAASAVLTSPAAAAAGPHAVRIAAGPLEESLVTLATQTHEQLLYVPGLVAGRRGPAVSGSMTVEQALALLLDKTDITVTRAGPAVLVLRGQLAVAPTTAPRAGDDRAPEVVQGHPFVAEPPNEPGAGPSPAATTMANLQKPNTVKELEITGTHIRGGRSASPLLILGREAIDYSGRATLAETLEALPQNFSGVATEGTVTTGADKIGRNAAYSSSINLRGLGPDATLVLINGRRMAGAGAFGDFADVSSIPTSAVQRVEILLDGASALYGSDAVGGVVNVILRRDFEGAETRLFEGTATRGEPVQTQVGQLFGHRWSSGNVMLSYEYQRRTALSGDDRSFAANADLRPFGGSDQRLSFAFPGNLAGFAIPAGQNGVGLTPSEFLAGVVNRTNQRQGEDLLPRQTLQSVYATANQSLGERLEFSADARYSHRDFSIRSSVPITSLMVARANPFYVAPNGAASERIAYSFAGQLPNVIASGRAETLGGSLGARLRLFSDWQAEGYLAYAQETDVSRSRGLLNSTAVSEALGSVPGRPETGFDTAVNGFLNPFAGVLGANNSAILNYISEGFTEGHSRDLVTSANLQADGALFELPGGAIKLAFGGQLRREHLVRDGINFTSTVTPVSQQPTDETRNVAAAYAELRAPLVGPLNAFTGARRLEVSLAGRIEHYDDIGSTANPHVGVIWQPVEDVTLRGTYGTSFRAPALREVHDLANNTPVFFALGSTRVLGLTLSGGNPDLKPETATTWTLGGDFTPARLPGLRLSATWFDVTFKSRIDRPVLNNTLNALTDPSLASFVTRISPTTDASDLALITALLARPQTNTSQGVFPATSYGAIVQTRYVNTTGLNVEGVDVEGSYRFDLGTDRITLNANATYLMRYAQQITPTSATVERVGIANFPVRVRGRASADWTRGRLTLGAALNYISAYHDSLVAKIGDQPTMDLQARLSAPATGPWRGVSATLSVRNAFDRAPPFYDNSSGVGYDPANADPIGRFVSLQLTREW
jgi:iron complex outermembrane receptor protein